MNEVNQEDIVNENNHATSANNYTLYTLDTSKQKLFEQKYFAKLTNKLHKEISAKDKSATTSDNYNHTSTVGGSEQLLPEKEIIATEAKELTEDLNKTEHNYISLKVDSGSREQTEQGIFKELSTKSPEGILRSHGLLSYSTNELNEQCDHFVQAVSQKQNKKSKPQEFLNHNFNLQIQQRLKDNFTSANEKVTTLVIEENVFSQPNYEKTDNNERLQKWNEQITEEIVEWDAVSPPCISKNHNEVYDDITYEDAFKYFKDFQYTDIVKPYQANISTFWKTIKWLFGPKNLIQSLQEQRNLVLHIANTSMDNNNHIHCRIIQTIYRKLTRSKQNYPKIGRHWEDIGFQGQDPATDLRGMGFLSLLHLLFFVTKHESLACDIYKLSLHENQNFPFCLLSINITGIALNALQKNKLSYACNERNEVVDIVNEFYVSTFLHFYEVWRNEGKTMLDSGHVIKNIETYALKNTKTLLKTYKKHITKYQLNNQPQGFVDGSVSCQPILMDKKQNDEFTGIVELARNTMS